MLIAVSVVPVRAQDGDHAGGPQPNPLGVLDTSKFGGKTNPGPYPEMLDKPLPSDTESEPGPVTAPTSSPPEDAGPSDKSAAPAEPAAATPGSTEPSAATPAPPAPAQTEPASPPDEGTASIKPVPSPPAPEPFVDTADAQRLRDKARAAVATGDIAAARALLDGLAARRDPEAAFLLAQTYDPSKLAEWGVVGVGGDPDRASTFYRQAARAGYPTPSRSDLRD